jgi:hypothetical protein
MDLLVQCRKSIVNGPCIATKRRFVRNSISGLGFVVSDFYSGEWEAYNERQFAMGGERGGPLESAANSVTRETR